MVAPPGIIPGALFLSSVRSPFSKQFNLVPFWAYSTICPVRSGPCPRFARLQHTHTPLPVLPVKFKTAATPPAIFLRVLPGLHQQPVHAEIKLCPSDWNEMIKVGRSAPVDIAEAPFLLEQYIVTT